MKTQALALVSRGGRAIVRSGEDYFVLTADDPEPRPADATHWAHLRGFHPGIEAIPAGAHPFVEVRARMLAAWREQLCLDLVAYTLDREQEDDFRLETCVQVENLLADYPAVGEQVRALMLSAKPPEEADFAGAIASAKAAGAARLERLLAEVNGSREGIAAALEAWRHAIKALPSPAEWTGSTAALERLLAVARAVTALQSPAPVAWSELRSWCRAELEPALMAATTEAPALIDRWLAAMEHGRAAASELLSASDAAGVARAIRERLVTGGPVEAPERRRCDAVLRAAECCGRDGARARLAEAVLSLLGGLVLHPEAVPLSAEWPAGLFVITRGMPWSAPELDSVRRLLVSFLYQARRDRSWQTEAEGGSDLGSVALEVHRAARFVGLDPVEHAPALAASIDVLLGRTGGGAEGEIGSLLGILASYGRAAARTAAQHLRRVDLSTRDLVLAAAARELRSLQGTASVLVDAVLHIIGGLGNVYPIGDRPTAHEQRWAALAARRLAALAPAELEARIDLILVPQPVTELRKTKAPPWVRAA
jgi:hypothetical protein